MRAKVRRIYGSFPLRWEAYSDELLISGFGLFKKTAIWDLENKIFKARGKKYEAWEDVEIDA